MVKRFTIGKVIFTVEEYHHKLEGVISYGDAETLIIPHEIKDKSESFEILEIDTAVDGIIGSFNKVIISEGIQIINEGAFDGLNSNTVVIPSTVDSIPENCFANSSIESIEGIGHIKKIGEGAFLHCTRLKAFTWPKNVSCISKNAFNGCTSLETITNTENVSLINTGAFKNCSSLKSFIFPEKVRHIDCMTFFGCKSLSSITLGDSLQGIYDYAFAFSGLISLHIPDSVHQIGSGVFMECEKLKEVTGAASENLNMLHSYVFYNCPELQRVPSFKQVTEIREAAFAKSGLKAFDLPPKVKTIPNHCFMDSSLETITGLENITKIKDEAFRNCPVKELDFTNSQVEEICEDSFSGVNPDAIIPPYYGWQWSY